ncbi:hypothetical protein [Arthrobacter antioxidans]|uniref:hypothetical protein n=1 Tax=Arthrobacter antioxidans TaxID=2895818 RepID=UPI001FFEC7F5|nr:hypothetical protein [Arthrobacter antioxidans]
MWAILVAGQEQDHRQDDDEHGNGLHTPCQGDAAAADETFDEDRGQGDHGGPDRGDQTDGEAAPVMNGLDDDGGGRGEGQVPCPAIRRITKPVVSP